MTILKRQDKREKYGSVGNRLKKTKMWKEKDHFRKPML
jgi:hypothetical protein